MANNKRFLFSPIVLLFSIICLSGCGGAKFKIIAKNANKPISLSSAVYDSQGKVLICPDDLTIVHHFKHTLSHYAVLWTLVDISPSEHDISEVLDQELSTHQGDAIINLKTTVEAWNFCINYLALIPIVPSRVVTYVEGDVVRLRSR